MNNRRTGENKRIVSVTDFRFDYPFRKLHNINCGNIGAHLGAAWRKIFVAPLSLQNCSVYRRAAVVAALVALALSGPGTAFASSQEQPARRAAVAERPAPAQQTPDRPQWIGERGSASWYGKSPRYKRTASGERFDQHAMTAAHPWLPFGAKVRVTRRDTGKSIVVTINDRLPSKKHIIDLSVGAAQQLGMLREGTTQVEITPAS